MKEFLGPRTWRRIERRAIRSHDRDLGRHLAALTRAASTVVDVHISSSPGAALVRLAGHRLILGPVSRAATDAVGGLVQSGSDVRLARAGRYGRNWWIAVTSSAGDEVILLGGRLQITHDRGRQVPSDTALPTDRRPVLVR